MGYRLANMRINSSTNCCTSCEKIVKIGSKMFEIKWGRKLKLCCDSHETGLYCLISQKLLNQSLQCFSVGINIYIYADYKTDINFTVVQGTLLWYPINFGRFLPTSKWPSSLFAVQFWNEMHYHLADACINSCTNCTRSCKKWCKLVR